MTRRFCWRATALARFTSPALLLASIAMPLTACSASSNEGIAANAVGSTSSAMDVATDYSDANGWTDPADYSTIQFPDVNGDGKADVCAHQPGGAAILCRLSTGTGWGDSITLALSSNPHSTLLASPQYYSTIAFPDVNGDGKSDFCARLTTGVLCYLSNGNGFGSAVAGAPLADGSGWSAAPYYSTIAYPDINGDGTADNCARGVAGVGCAYGVGDGSVSIGLDGYAFPALSDANASDPNVYSTIQ